MTLWPFLQTLEELEKSYFNCSLDGIHICIQKNAKVPIHYSIKVSYAQKYRIKPGLQTS